MVLVIFTLLIYQIKKDTTACFTIEILFFIFQTIYLEIINFFISRIKMQTNSIRVFDLPKKDYE